MSVRRLAVNSVSPPCSWPWKLAITRSARLRAHFTCRTFSLRSIGLGSVLIANLLPRRNVLPRKLYVSVAFLLPGSLVAAPLELGFPADTLADFPEFGERCRIN